MHYRIFMAGVLLTGSAAAQMSAADSDIALHAPSPGWHAYGKVQAWAAYDAIPVKNFSGTWSAHYTPRDGRNVFMQRDRAEFGVEKDGWRVGLEYRLELSLQSNRDTVEIYHLYQQHRHPDTATRFAADAHLKGWSAGGVRIGRTFALGGAAANAPLLMLSSALYGTARNRDSDASGTVRYTPADAYHFDANYFSTNDKYRYPFMPDAAQKSSGSSVSVALQWPLGSQLTANLAVNDLWSRLRWSNLPAIDKVINSDVRSVDSDGYVNYQPQVHGKSSVLDHTSRIGASTALNLSYARGQWQLRAGMERIEGTNIPQVSGSYRARWGTFSTSYETRFNTLGLGYEAGPFRTRLRTNRLPLADASAFALELGLHFLF